MPTKSVPARRCEPSRSDQRELREDLAEVPRRRSAGQTVALKSATHSPTICRRRACLGPRRDDAAGAGRGGVSVTAMRSSREKIPRRRSLPSSTRTISQRKSRRVWPSRLSRRRSIEWSVRVSSGFRSSERDRRERERLSFRRRRSPHERPQRNERADVAARRVSPSDLVAIERKRTSLALSRSCRRGPV